jgi:osmotically-inducible protein OsmY
MGSMGRSFFLIVAVAAVSAGCSTNTATQERQPIPPMRAEAAPAPTPAAVTVPDNPADRSIRRDLTLALARDADLHNKEISFIVANGDVSVTGIVRTEGERRKINDLAMNIDGVKSVANALRVAQ